MSSLKLLQKSLILWTNLHLTKREQGSHRNKECFCGILQPVQSLMGRCSSCHTMRMTSHVGEATHHCNGLFSSRTTSSPLLKGSFYEQCRTLRTQPWPLVFLTSFVSLKQSQTDFLFCVVFQIWISNAWLKNDGGVFLHLYSSFLYLSFYSGPHNLCC